MSNEDAWADARALGDIADLFKVMSEPDGEDFAQDATTEGSVNVGGSATGNIDRANDFDWFAIELVAGRTYVIDLEGVDTDAGTLRNPVIRGLYREDGPKIEGTQTPTGGEGRNAQLTFTPEETGTYYVVARGIAKQTGTYTVSLSDITPEPPPEPGPEARDTEPPPQEPPPKPTIEYVDEDEELVSSRQSDDLPANTTTPVMLTIGEPYESTISSQHDTDWVAVDLVANVKYVIHMRGAHTDSGTLPNPIIPGIYDANGDRVGDPWHQNDSFIGYASSIGQNARVYFTPDTTQTYYIALSSPGGDNRDSQGNRVKRDGTYEVEVNYVPRKILRGETTDAEDFPADQSTPGKIVVNGHCIASELQYDADTDWFRVQLIGGIEVSIQIRGNTQWPLRWQAKDLWWQVYDSDGEVAALRRF